VSRLRLYIDEDALDGDMVRGLRSHAVDVITAMDAGMMRRADEEHLPGCLRPGPRAILFQRPPFSPNSLRLGRGRARALRHYPGPATALHDRRANQAFASVDRLDFR
jgi:hypothetical protein